MANGVIERVKRGGTWKLERKRNEGASAKPGSANLTFLNLSRFDSTTAILKLQY